MHRDTLAYRPTPRWGNRVKGVLYTLTFNMFLPFYNVCWVRFRVFEEAGEAGLHGCPYFLFLIIADMVEGLNQGQELSGGVHILTGMKT